MFTCKCRVVSKAAMVRKFLLLPEDFSMAGGELTPTLKVLFVVKILKLIMLHLALFQVKRHFVCEKYSTRIEEMYQHEEISSMW